MTNVAAIDCGTNGTRLLVADAATGAALTRRITITRLGQDVDRTGRLAPDAIERVAAALTDYKALLDHHGVTPDGLRVVATSAARDAANTDDFFDAVHRILGTRPELLSADEEGRLSFLGATRDLDPGNGPYLVVDIGGGSTEFVTGHAEPTGIVSIDVGCVRITERYLHDDPPDPGELSDALSIIRSHLDDVVRSVPATLDAARLVGLSGTVTAMASIEQGLASYDRDRIHHFALTRAAAEDVFRTVATESRSRRRHNPGLEPDRVDVIVGGALILVSVFRHFDFDECLVSEADMLEGLVHELPRPAGVSPTVYKNDAGRDAITAWCRDAIDHWRTPHETRILRTGLGLTSVVVAGGGREAPLVVLPGTNFCGAALLPFADILARRRHGQVLLVDLPGQPGLSDPNRAPNPSAYGAWLDEVLFQLDPTPRPIVLGHSLGAAIALHADPENPRLGPLVLVAPAGFTGAHLSLDLLKATVPWLPRPNPDTAHGLAEFMSSPANGVDPATTDWLRAVGRHCRATKAPAPLGGPELARWRDHPVHFVLGADDPFFRPGKVLAAARAAGVPTTHVTAVPDAGHLLPIERPDVIVDVLRGIDERRMHGR